MKLNGSRVSTVCKKPVTSGHVTKLVFFVFFSSLQGLFVYN